MICALTRWSALLLGVFAAAAALALSLHGRAASEVYGVASAPAEAGAACAADYLPGGWETPAVASEQGWAQFDDLVAVAAASRALYVGEVHDRPRDHAHQLELICRLVAAGRPVVIGVEFVQQPFQAYLDQYVAGRLDEAALRERTDYDRRWGYDFELYAPILRFARAQGLRVDALTAPSELSRKVARGGLEALAEAERGLLPAGLERAPRGYGPRLAASYEMAAAHSGLAFEHFETTQMLWDETMAQRVDALLAEHPDATVVVLAGTGHVGWRSGVPGRVARRSAVEGVVVTTVGGDRRGPRFVPDAVDFLLGPPSLGKGILVRLPHPRPEAARPANDLGALPAARGEQV